VTGYSYFSDSTWKCGCVGAYFAAETEVVGDLDLRWRISAALAIASSLDSPSSRRSCAAWNWHACCSA